MIIWIALLIPVITAIILYKKFAHQTVWWEFLIPFVVSILLIFLSKMSIETIQTQDTEYWGGCLTQADYYEAWNELVTYTETYTDSKGRSQTRTRTRVDYHPPQWKITDTNGCVISINQGTFESLCQRFGNRQFTDLRRNYHTNDGDLFTARWNGSEATLMPVTTSHSYENRVAVSDSVFHFPEVNPKDFGLVEYPKIQNYFQCNSIVGPGDASLPLAEQALSCWNAKLGPQKQARIILVVFQNQPVQAGFDQESYWQGGNKNEFVITIGVDNSNNIVWCHPFSWTEVETLKVETREFVISQKTLHLKNLVDWVAPQVSSNYVRKNFADFNYLSIEPPMWAVFLVFLLVSGVNLGLSMWIVHNEHQEFGANQNRFGRAIS